MIGKTNALICIILVNYEKRLHIPTLKTDLNLSQFNSSCFQGDE
jgi:hypothetical protein